MPRELEQSVLSRFARYGGGAIFRKTSCGVSYAYSMSDYNGHFGIRELCDICPARQVALCRKGWRMPSVSEVSRLAETIGVVKPFGVNHRAVEYHGLSEQPRYYIQHALNYQVHDTCYPHFLDRHGRAGEGEPYQPSSERTYE